MNRFIYYYSVFDIRVNQTQGEPHQPPLHCLAYLKMGIAEGKSKRIRGTNPLLRDILWSLPTIRQISTTKVRQGLTMTHGKS